MTPAFDSDAYDREVMAERRRQRDAQLKMGGPGRSPYCPPPLTDAELKRRKRADAVLSGKRRKPPSEVTAARKAARSQRPGTVRWPRPRQKPNGRWLAACVHNQVLHTRTFDTREEAEQFIRQVKEGQ